METLLGWGGSVRIWVKLAAIFKLSDTWAQHKLRGWYGPLHLVPAPRG